MKSKIISKDHKENINLFKDIKTESNFSTYSNNFDRYFKGKNIDCLLKNIADHRTFEGNSLTKIFNNKKKTKEKTYRIFRIDEFKEYLDKLKEKEEKINYKIKHPYLIRPKISKRIYDIENLTKMTCEQNKIRYMKFPYVPEIGKYNPNYNSIRKNQYKAYISSTNYLKTGPFKLAYIKPKNMTEGNIKDNTDNSKENNNSIDNQQENKNNSTSNVIDNQGSIYTESEQSYNNSIKNNDNLNINSSQNDNSDTKNDTKINKNNKIKLIKNNSNNNSSYVINNLNSSQNSHTMQIKNHKNKFLNKNIHRNINKEPSYYSFYNSSKKYLKTENNKNLSMTFLNTDYTNNTNNSSYKSTINDGDNLTNKKFDTLKLYLGHVKGNIKFEKMSSNKHELSYWDKQAYNKMNNPSLGFYKPNYKSVNSKTRYIIIDKKKAIKSKKRYMLEKILCQFDVPIKYQLIKTLNVE